MKWSDWEVVGDEDLRFQDVIYEKKRNDDSGASVARITVNRPERYNAFTGATMDEMFRAFFDASHDPMVGVVVLTGAEGNFGTGGDVEWEQWSLRELFYWRYTPNRLVRMCRKPVIAAVDGFCIGGSNHLAYCCDFTIASDRAIFGQNGPRVSSPADGSFLPYLTRVIGTKKAREMWMLCRRYSADEALAMGLVNVVVPVERLEQEVDQWCEELLSVSPGCLEILKAAFDQEFDMFPELGVISGTMYPDWFEMEEGRAGSEAFLAKTKPDFWAARRRQAESKRDKGTER